MLGKNGSLSLVRKPGGVFEGLEGNTGAAAHSCHLQIALPSEHLLGPEESLENPQSE